MDKSRVSLLCTGLLMLGLAGCQKQAEAPAAGPAEQAGRKLDQAAAEIKPGLEKLGEKAGAALQDAGRKLQEKSADAKPAEKPGN